jgi:hypothetical protein
VIVPAPESGERIVFISHFERGFGLPTSDFFRDFLDTYDLQPHHLPANAVMILSAFAAFCEGFAGTLKMKQIIKSGTQSAATAPAPAKPAPSSSAMTLHFGKAATRPSFF